MSKAKKYIGRGSFLVLFVANQTSHVWGMLSQLPEVHLFRANAGFQNLHFQKSKKVRSKKLNKSCSVQSDILDADLWVHLPFGIVHIYSSYDEPNPRLEKK